MKDRISIIVTAMLVAIPLLIAFCFYANYRVNESAVGKTRIQLIQDFGVPNSAKFEDAEKDAESIEVMEWRELSATKDNLRERIRIAVLKNGICVKCRGGY